MKKTLVAIVALVVAMAFTGCNREKSKAESMVKDFLKENLVENDFKVMDFSRLDSTTFVSDSLFQLMREKGAKDSRFKQPLDFSDDAKTKKLLFIRVKYRIEKDTILQTFYFDDELSRVVSFKEG
ncbi:MAG: hypothetical protein II509_04110 [Prevotella sp.]|jgi:hypothetical protein|nr:hypothetical protein [Prevotella sp.]MBQ4484031.1 hypothetical protein [Prevotella sp.]MDY6248505.1 hypothetical protein [Prevotella sp.]